MTLFTALLPHKIGREQFTTWIDRKEGRKERKKERKRERRNPN